MLMKHCSTATRSAAQEAKLGVLGIWYHIVRAQGYIFFGTASRLHRLTKVHIQTNNPASPMHLPCTVSYTHLTLPTICSV